MIAVDIPGHGPLRLEYLLLDVNGTLTCDGVLLPGVAELLRQLRCLLDVQLVTADTRGTAGRLASMLGVSVTVVPAGEEAISKAEVARRLGVDRVAAIGNGAVDAALLAKVALGIVVVGPEGAAVSALLAGDVVVNSVDAALGLLLDERRLIATLRC